MEGFYDNELGSVHISPEIVRSVVVPEVSASKNLDFATGNRGKNRDVTLEFQEGKAVINVALGVAIDTAIFKETAKLQSDIKRAIEATTGLDVAAVNVRVERVCFPGEKPRPAPVAEKKKEAAK